MYVRLHFRYVHSSMHVPPAPSTVPSCSMCGANRLRFILCACASKGLTVHWSSSIAGGSAESRSGGCHSMAFTAAIL